MPIFGEADPELLGDLADKRTRWQQQQDVAGSEAARLAAQREVRAQISKQSRRARDLAEERAHSPGGHAYLGRDALSRDYHSEWLPIGEVAAADQPTIEEVQLERVSDILRDHHNIELGVRFRCVRLNRRYRDAKTGVSSSAQHSGIEFRPDEIIINPYREPVAVLPGDENWGIVDDILNALAATDSASGSL